MFSVAASVWAAYLDWCVGNKLRRRQDIKKLKTLNIRPTLEGG